MNTKNKIQRINNVIGQLEGIKKMIEDNKDCYAILTQLNASKSAIGSLANYLIDENFSECLTKSKKNDDLKKIIKLLTKNN